MAFQARWRELKREGWTSKPPTGLSNDFFSIKRGKNKKCLRGDDFFVGEHELMVYLDRLDLGKLERINGWFTVPYKSFLLLVEIQRQKKKDNHKHATSKEISRASHEPPVEIEGIGDRNNPPHTESPENPGPNREVIATSPHAMGDAESAANSQEGGSTVQQEPNALSPQRSLNREFIAVKGDVSSDEGPDHVLADAEAEFNLTIPVYTSVLDEETKGNEVLQCEYCHDKQKRPM